MCPGFSLEKRFVGSLFAIVTRGAYCFVLLFADALHENLAKARVEKEIDEEIDAGVEHDQRVTDALVVILEVSAQPRVVVQHIPEDLVDEGRGLADREDDDDDDEDEGDVVVLLLPRGLHLLPLLAQRVQRANQPHVQDRQQDEGQDQEENHVHSVVVNDEIQSVGTEPYVHGDDFGLIALVCYGNQFGFREARDVVEDAEDDRDQDLLAGLVHRAQPGR